jgi:hypothetical protein
VPGAIIEAHYVEGNRVDTAKYEVLKEHAVIRWTPSDQPQRVAASVKLTEQLTLGTETDRWKKLAIILPVVATIVSAAIAGFATYYSKAGVESKASTNVPVPKNASAPSSATDADADNTSMKRAQAIPLGQPIMGVATQQERWFQFYIDDSNSRRIRTSFKNRYSSGYYEMRIMNSQGVELKSTFIAARDTELSFISPQAEVYYIEVKSKTASNVYYELMVSKQ